MRVTSSSTLMSGFCSSRAYLSISVKLNPLFDKGLETPVVPLNSLASVDVNKDGQVLVSQLENCGQHALYYDLYTLQKGSLIRLTHCSRYRLAKWQSARRIVALRYEHGIAVLDRLNSTIIDLCQQN